MCVCVCVQMRYLTWGHIWKEVLQLPPEEWKIPGQVVLGKWDTMVDAAKETVKQLDNRKTFLKHIAK